MSKRTMTSAFAATAAVLLAATWIHASAHTVSQKGKTFAPGTLTVKAGDTITFKNDDDVTHNAFSTSKGNEFNSKAQTPGSLSPIVLKAKGTVDVKCAFHPRMSLTITVE
jgi:plastocyanin